MTINARRQAFVAAVLQRLRRIGRARRDAGREELLAMGERELCDIAIGRGEIRYLLMPGAQRATKPQWRGASTPAD